MTKIYLIISKLNSKFKKMCYGLTHNETDIEDACQELQMYFLQMNKDTLKNIYETSGEDGLIRYGAVVLRRALTSPRSPFYYKYKKYYTHIDSFSSNSSNSITNIDYAGNNSYYKNISNIPNEEILEEYQWHKLEQIDKVLDNLYWYDKKLFELYYYEGNTLDSLAKKTKISRNSLFTTIDKVREILKKELADE